MRHLALPLLVAALATACTAAPPVAQAPAVSAYNSAAPARERPVVLRIRNLRGMTDRVDRSVRLELERALKARGIEITRRPTGWTHELRGRFTSLNEANATSITYIFDIAPAGRAPSVRITGFERVAGSSSDPWSGMDATLARRLALHSAERIVRRLREPSR